MRAADLGTYGRTMALGATRDHLSATGQALRSLVRAKAGTILFPKSGAAVATNNRALLSIDAPFVSHLMAVEPGPGLDPRWAYHWLTTIDMREHSDNDAYPSVKQSVAQKIGIPVPPLAEQRRIADRLDEAMAQVAGARAALGSQLNDCSRLRFAVIEEVLGGRAIATDDRADQEGDGWVALTGVARLESGHTPSRKRPEWWGGDVPWIALPDIRALDGMTAEATTETTNELGLANSSARLLPEGTVMLSRTASVGFVSVMGRPMATSQDFVNWVPGPKVRAWYLAYALIGARDHLRRLSSGAVHKTIYMPTLKSLHIRLPSPREQDWMLDRIRKAHAIVDRTRRSIEAQSAALAALPASLLSAAFRGEL